MIAENARNITVITQKTHHNLPCLEKKTSIKKEKSLMDYKYN
jgi:hypothetical protein